MRTAVIRLAIAAFVFVGGLVSLRAFSEPTATVVSIAEYRERMRMLRESADPLTYTLHSEQVVDNRGAAVFETCVGEQCTRQDFRHWRSTESIYRSVNQVRIDFTRSDVEGTSIVIVTPTLRVQCRGGSLGSCQDYALYGVPERSDRLDDFTWATSAPEPGQFVDYEPGSVHSFGRSILGESAQCFALEQNGNKLLNDIEQCFTRDGIPVFESVTNGSYTSIWRATSIERAVDESVFQPPYHIVTESELERLFEVLLEDEGAD